MSQPRLRLGQLLVDAGLITPEVLSDALELQKTDGRRLGTQLVARGLLDETQLTQILSHQLSVPWVSLLHIEFTRQLLNLVPRETAERYCLVPIYVRHVRRQGDTLYVAMDDPTNEDALRECSAFSGLPTRAMIAPPSDIRDAIRVYYGAGATGAAPSKTADTAAPPRLEDTDIGETAFDEKGAFEAAAVHEAGLESDLVAAAEPKEVREQEARETAGGEQESVEERETEPAEEATEAGIAPPAGTSEGAGAADASATDIAAVPDVVGEIIEPTVEEAAPMRPPISDAPVIETVELDLSQRARERVRELAGEEDVEAAPIPRPKGRARRMISVTLLDGTTITLPTRARKRSGDSDQPEEVRLEPKPAPVEGDEDEGLTARDLIAALRAVAHGADPHEILGGTIQWERLFAALLSVLLRKHLIADWEYVEELKKM